MPPSLSKSVPFVLAHHLKEKTSHFYLRAICEQKGELIPRPPIVQALNYMQQDLAVAKKLGDIAGECRAHGNLGSAYFSKGNYKVFQFLDGFKAAITMESLCWTRLYL